MANNNIAFLPGGPDASPNDTWMGDQYPAIVWDPASLSFYFVGVSGDNSLRVAQYTYGQPLRGHFNRAVMDRAGNLIPGCTIRLIDSADGITTLSDPIYTTGIGTGTLPNPFICDTGVIDFYLESPKRVRIGVTKPGSGVEVVFDAADVLAPQ